MSDRIKVTGMILKTMPIGEYDKRVTLLTTDNGKIGAFVRGARRPGSRLMAASEPFVFGDFELIEGRNSYTVGNVEVRDYFNELRGNVEAVLYGSYFLEFADYYGRENNQDKDMLALLYLTIRALIRAKVDYRLIRCIYEFRVMAVNGDWPQVFQCVSCHKREHLKYFNGHKGGLYCEDCRGDAGMGAVKMDEAAVYALQYILSSPPEKLYSFMVTDVILDQLRAAAELFRKRTVDRPMKSLELLDAMTAM